MQPLYVYVSANCAICDRALQIVAEIRRQRPHYPLQLIDLDQPDAVRPAFVFGTPTYMLGERIISLGNPSMSMILQQIDTEIVRSKQRAAAPPSPPIATSP